MRGGGSAACLAAATRERSNEQAPSSNARGAAPRRKRGRRRARPTVRRFSAVVRGATRERRFACHSAEKWSSSMPGWTVVKEKKNFKLWDTLTQSEQNKWDAFQDTVRAGTHPKEAAREIGDSDYKCLQGNQYQIRLSQHNRATFLVDDTTQTVTILQVGGHT
jgi:mRNA-degrading endonuclease RelE of RelBE toxin-antitoxin system